LLFSDPESLLRFHICLLEIFVFQIIQASFVWFYAHKTSF